MPTVSDLMHFSFWIKLKKVRAYDDYLTVLKDET